MAGCDFCRIEARGRSRADAFRLYEAAARPNHGGRTATRPLAYVVDSPNGSAIQFVGLRARPTLLLPRAQLQPTCTAARARVPTTMGEVHEGADRSGAKFNNRSRGAPSHREPHQRLFQIILLLLGTRRLGKRYASPS